MQMLHYSLPLSPLECATASASNQSHYSPRLKQEGATLCLGTPAGNVRFMRRLKDSDSNCFALSGKLSDVCAALDALAAQETRNAWRCALQ